MPQRVERVQVRRCCFVGAFERAERGGGPVAVDGGVCSLYPGDAGYAEARLEAPGPRHRAWLVDPRWRYERG